MNLVLKILADVIITVLCIITFKVKIHITYIVTHNRIRKESAPIAKSGNAKLFEW